MRRLFGLLALGALTCGCGGGGGGGDSDGAGPTPGPVQTLYVSTSGDDRNDGLAPATALKSVSAAASKLRPGGTVYVAPGRYPGLVDVSGVDGSASRPVALIADPTGTRTGDAAGDVILDADGALFAVRIQNSPFVVLDGFVITGAEDSGSGTPSAVRVQGSSDHVTIQHCVISNRAPIDGIRIESVADALIFDNLITNNQSGVVLRGEALRAQLINNTLVDNRSFGVILRSAMDGAPTDATLRNNIIQDTRNNISISVQTDEPSALPGYDGDFNLAFVADLDDQTRTYRPTTIRGDNDVNADALFANADDLDFHLTDDSPAIDAGTATIDEAFAAQLQQRSTDASGLPDALPLDLGYHYPAAVEPAALPH